MYTPQNLNFFNGFYTGVGSRSTPIYLLYMISKLAMIFEQQGFVLRSGCALGSDAAFEDALLYPNTTSEIYIPNKNFPSKMNTSFKSHYIIPIERYGKSFDGLYRQAMRLIHDLSIHKAWQRCKPYVMDLHNRNMFQVLGLDLQTPSKFTICYTKNGEKLYSDTDWNTGGTATAINASDLHKVKVFNVGNDQDFLRLKSFIEKHEHLIDYSFLNDIIPRTEHNENNLKYNDFLNTINEQENARLIEITK
jgi:hypothetical protein